MELATLKTVQSLDAFAQAIEPANVNTDNDFVVNGVQTEKTFHLPYLKVAQGTTFAMSNLTGHYVLRVENPVDGLNIVDVDGMHYMNLGSKVKGIVVGIAKSKMNPEEKLRFIPVDKTTVIPAEWTGKLRTVYYVAVYTGNALFVIEGVNTKRRVTDTIVNMITKKPSFYSIDLGVKLEKNDKGSFIAPVLEKIEAVKGNNELLEIKKMVAEYFRDRFEKSKLILQKRLGIVTLKETEIQEIDTVELPADAQIEKLEDESDDGDIPF